MGEKQTTRPLLAIGRIVGVHGIRGEVKIELLTDFPERYREGAEVLVGDERLPSTQTIEAARPHKGAMLVKFAGTADRNAAEAFRDQMVWIPEDQAMPLGEDENYAHDLIGLTVETADGRRLGKITEILYSSANDIYVVRGERAEVLIPALREVVLSVDLAAQRMVVALPEGLEGE